MKTIPLILTASTYTWKPANTATLRTANQQKRLTEVETFFRSIGMKTTREDDKVHGKIDIEIKRKNGPLLEIRKVNLHARFDYEETPGHIYKRLHVWKDGMKSNVAALKKLL